jgi:HEAT repeat protein
MLKGIQIALAVVLVSLAGVIGWQGLRLREPVYQGRRLGDWLAVYKMDGLSGVESWQVRVEQQKADEAVRHAGTNALPILLRMLRANDSALKIKCVELAKRQHLIRVKYTPAEELNYRACSGFGVLGAKAQNAVPALMEIANRNLSRASRWYAIEALVLVGPPAQEAIPLLSGWATNADGSVRSYAINALGRIRAEPERGLPVLINALNDPDVQIRTAALMALQGLGPNAKPALPVLVEFLSNAPSGIEWTYASNALKAIDPEAAAKAGVK